MRLTRQLEVERSFYDNIIWMDYLSQIEIIQTLSYACWPFSFGFMMLDTFSAFAVMLAISVWARAIWSFCH